jgi:hypothetical protein
VPRVEYVFAGFWAVEVVPSPNSHDHAVGVPVEVSVNCTSSGAVPDVGVAVKFATTPAGGGGVPPMLRIRVQ